MAGWSIIKGPREGEPDQVYASFTEAKSLAEARDADPEAEIVDFILCDPERQVEGSPHRDSWRVILAMSRCGLEYPGWLGRAMEELVENAYMQGQQREKTPAS